MIASRGRRQSLSATYIRFFLLILVAPVFVAGVALDSVYFSRLKRSAVGQTDALVSQVASALETEINQIRILSASLANNVGFLRACGEFVRTTDDRDRYRLRGEIDEHLADFFNYTNRIGTVYLFFPDRELFYHHNYPTYTTVEYFDRSIYAPALERRARNFLIPDLVGINPIDSVRPLVSIAVSPAGGAAQHGLEAILVSFRASTLDRIHRGEGPAAGAHVVVTDDAGTILVGAPGSERVLAPLIGADQTSGVVTAGEGANFLVSAARIGRFGWQVYRATDYKSFIRPLQRTRWMTYALFVAMSLLFTAYTRLFFRDMINPLHVVIERMKTVESGDYDAQVPVEGPEEIAQLGEAFNQMTSEVRRLTTEANEREREKNRYEMEALQYRIHPHFVANALNSIRMMAAAADSPHIAEMSTSLMRLVTESFNKGGRYISIEDEVESLRSYIHIMKVRFGELIDLKIDIPRELLPRRILKMLLQPIVENSVLHGIRESNRAGIVEVAARAGSCTLTITVRDNGAGVDPEILGRLLEGPAPESSRGLTRIGLFNVHRRIALNYGEDYGLAVRNAPTGGAEVRLTLPDKGNGGDGQ